MIECDLVAANGSKAVLRFEDDARVDWGGFLGSIMAGTFTIPAGGERVCIHSSAVHEGEAAGGQDGIDYANFGDSARGDAVPLGQGLGGGCEVCGKCGISLPAGARCFASGCGGLPRTVATSSRMIPEGVPGFGVRGPNWVKNRANRIQYAVRRREEREKYVAKKAVDDYREAHVSQDWRSRSGKPLRTPEEEKLYKLRLERQIIQEERKLDKLKSPRQMVEDAIKQIEMAERCAKVANDNKVARWAADLSSASAESIARSSGSYKSYGSYRSSGVGRVETVATSKGSEGGNRAFMTTESYDGKTPVVPDDRFDVDEEWLVSEVAINMRAMEEDNDGKVRNGKYMGKSLTPGMFSSRPAVVNPGKVNSAANHLNRVKQSYRENTGSSGPASGYSSVSHAKAMNDSFDKYMAVQVASERRAIEHLDKLGFIDENGRVYNQETAKAWVDKHAFIRKHVHITKTEAQIAKDAGVKESDVSRFFCLRREFKLK